MGNIKAYVVCCVTLSGSTTILLHILMVCACVHTNTSTISKFLTSNLFSLLISTGDKKYTTQSKNLVKLFCDEIDSTGKCKECFVNANLHGNWFSMVCSTPHLVLWAKFASFPLWPCKLMNVDGNTAYVRFFGDHKHAKIDVQNLFLYSRVTSRTTKKALVDALHVRHFETASINSLNGILNIFTIFVLGSGLLYPKCIIEIWWHFCLCER